MPNVMTFLDGWFCIDLVKFAFVWHDEIDVDESDENKNGNNNKYGIQKSIFFVFYAFAEACKSIDHCAYGKRYVEDVVDDDCC